MTPAAPDPEFHYLRVEVTVAAALVSPDERIVGNNMVDATVAFGWRTDDPGERSDAEINGALSRQISPVLALISTALLTQGWVDMGQVEEPMAEAPAKVVGHGMSTPVTVHVVPEGAGAHD
jgi:hypothetical protein